MAEYTDSPITAWRGFFNDVFWFDQRACSSPHLLVWVGPAVEMDAAVDRFHAA